MNNIKDQVKKTIKWIEEIRKRENQNNMKNKVKILSSNKQQDDKSEIAEKIATIKKLVNLEKEWGRKSPHLKIKKLLFQESEEFWTEFEKWLKDNRQNNKRQSKERFPLALKELRKWKKEWLAEKDSINNSEKVEEVDSKSKSMDEIKEESKIRKVKCKGELNLAGFKLPCYVLEDGTRILSGRGMANALKMVDGSSKSDSGIKLGQNLSQKSLKPFVNEEIKSGHFEPIIYYDKNKEIHGYEATTLADICRIYSKANREIHLSPRQKIIADQCIALLEAFAKVGILALVDEATGYQYERLKNLENKKQTQINSDKSWGPFTYSIEYNTLTYQNIPLPLVYRSEIGGWWFSLKQEETIIRIWVNFLEENWQIATHLKIIEKETETNYKAFFSYLKTNQITFFFQPFDEVVKNKQGKWTKKEVPSHQLNQIVQSINRLPNQEKETLFKMFNQKNLL